MTPFFAIVTWNDAWGDAVKQVWEVETISHQPLRIHTAGWVVKEDAMGVTLFTDLVENGDGTHAFRGHGFIPRGMIVEVKRPGEAPGKRKRK